MKVEEHIIQQADSKPIILDIKFAEGNEKTLSFSHMDLRALKTGAIFNLMSEQFANAGFDFLKFNFSHNGGTMEEPIDFPDLKHLGIILSVLNKMTLIGSLIGQKVILILQKFS